MSFSEQTEKNESFEKNEYGEHLSFREQTEKNESFEKNEYGDDLQESKEDDSQESKSKKKDAENYIFDNEDEDNDEYNSVAVMITYICEDCDYRWDSKQEFNDDNYQNNEDDSHEHCPMCGSANTIHLQ